MKIKLIKKNLIICILIFLVCSLVAAFGSFDYVSTKYINPAPNLAPAGSMTAFNFIPQRDKTSGFMAKFTKNIYGLDIKDQLLEVKITYEDWNGKNQEYTKLIPVRQIINGVQKISFPPLMHSKNEIVTVTFTVIGDPIAPENFSLSNQSYNPNPNINTSPRLIYHVRVRGLIKETWESFMRDPKFTYFYLSVSGLLLIIILGLYLFRIEENYLPKNAVVKRKRNA
jgi:hypothetical protein